MDPYVHFTISLFGYQLHIALSKGHEDIIATSEFVRFFSDITPGRHDARLTCTVLSVPPDIPLSDKGDQTAPILQYAFLREMFTHSGPDVQKLIEPTRLVFFRPDVMDMQAYTCECSGHEARSAIDFFLFIFVSTLLGRNRGLLLHACGLVIDGLACAITGPSGAGKSTAGGLIRKEFVLADDIIGISGIDDPNGRIQGHATPLSSSRITDGPCRAPLAAIFFPTKSKSFSLRRIEPRDAFVRYLREHAHYIGRMIKSCKPVYFELGHILFHKIPAYELHFTRDYIDTEAIRKVMREGFGRRELRIV